MSFRVIPRLKKKSASAIKPALLNKLPIAHTDQIQARETGNKKNLICQTHPYKFYLIYNFDTYAAYRERAAF